MAKVSQYLLQAMLGDFLFWIKPHQKLDRTYRQTIGGSLNLKIFPLLYPQHKIWPKLIAKNPIHYLLKTTSFLLGFRILFIGHAL
jgi:hypothetical protein